MFEPTSPGQKAKSFTQACEELAQAFLNVGRAISKAISQALAGLASFIRAGKAHHWARQHRQALERQIEHDQALRWQRLEAKFTPTNNQHAPGKPIYYEDPMQDPEYNVWILNDTQEEAKRP